MTLGTRAGATLGPAAPPLHLGPADGSAVRTARWVGVLFGLLVVLQRFALPGGVVPLLLPVVVAWAALAVLAGVAEFDRRRALWWTSAAAATGVALVVGPVVVPAPSVSLSSWALLMITWLPFVVRLVDRRVETARLALGHVIRIGSVLAVACLVMLGSGLLGLPYRDLLADLVGEQVLLTGFSTTYPFTYGSELYKSNAWIGLEPSFVSFQLGVALFAAILLGRSLRVVLLLAVGLLATAAGSGMLIVAAGAVALAFWPRRRVLVRYLLPLGVVVVAVLSTPFGWSLLSRTSEVTERQSSSSLRLVEGYLALWPSWTGDLAAMLLGLGPGSAQRVADGTGTIGLLVPTPAKVFYEYGLVAGLALAGFLVVCYLGGPSPALSLTLFVSLATIQPGSTSVLLAASVLTLISLWAPRPDPPLDATPAGRPP